MTDKLRVVLVGCGGISGTWLNGASQNDDLEVVGLVDLNEDAAKARKEEFGLEGAVTGTDLESMLKDLEPDAVFDATLPETHVTVALTAMEHGCHVLGEKPLADSMENARRIVEASRQSGKIHAVIQNRRYDARIRAYREFIASGKIGDLTTLNSDFFIGAHFGGFRDRMKHVLLLDMAIHTIDMARFFSAADPVAVYCKEWNPRGSWYDHDASAVAIFEMSDGIVYTYRGSWCAEGVNTTWEADWRAIGSKGSAIWDGADTFRAQSVAKTGAFIFEQEDHEVPIPENAKQGGHKGLIEEFVRCIRTGETPETVCSDNIKSLAMVFGAIESAETGRRVEIADAF